ncbi:MAG TPA: universal stress protein, partial [Solimonas sp.]|nr:universal stress protein [Solimonas sp.]
MSLYTHILAAVELDDSGSAVLARAQELATKFGAQLAVLHVVEYVAIDAGEALMAAPPDLSRQLLDQAR